LSKSKIEYVKCRFNCEEPSWEEATMGGVAIPRVEKFRYLGSIIEEKGGTDEDINQCMSGMENLGALLEYCVKTKCL